VERTLARHLALALDLSAEEGHLDAALAGVTVREVVLTAGVLVSASARRWSFGVVPAFSVALASLTATPRAPDARGGALEAVWAGPTLGARARLALGRAASLVAEASGGFTTRRVTGLIDDQTRLFELGGPWLALGLGVGWSF
jgi:hypothetical protein